MANPSVPSLSEVLKIVCLLPLKSVQSSFQCSCFAVLYNSGLKTRDRSYSVAIDGVCLRLRHGWRGFPSSMLAAIVLRYRSLFSFFIRCRQ